MEMSFDNRSFSDILGWWWLAREDSVWKCLFTKAHTGSDMREWRIFKTSLFPCFWSKMRCLHSVQLLLLSSILGLFIDDGVRCQKIYRIFDKIFSLSKQTPKNVWEIKIDFDEKPMESYFFCEPWILHHAIKLLNDQW